MKARFLVGTLIAVGLATPAAARNYYIVENIKTHKCSVAKTKPSEKSKTVALVGDGTAYKTKAEANTAMGGMDACKANPT